MNKAFVEITYSSDAASFGGFATEPTMHAEIYEVDAESISHACYKSKEKFKELNKHGMCTLRGCKFLRWVNNGMD